jgi:predicted phosphodiesterase
MRIAVFSDVHGNLPALEAVLADATAAAVEEFWVLGDLVAHGPHPDKVIRRLMDLPNARFVRGNTDRYVMTGDLPPMIRGRAQARTPDEIELLVAVTASFSWTRGAITAAGGYEWLAGLPVQQWVTLPDGTTVLLVHASPGRDEGPGVQADMTDQELRAAGIAVADLIFLGHTHVPLDRTVAGVRIVNLGSVSVPATPERRAMWTLLTADQDGFAIERRFSAYDIDAVVAALDEVHFPSAEWLKAKLSVTNDPVARQRSAQPIRSVTVE